ncbi:MAG: hypothetical protein LBS34_00205 [Rickettsiales bacterium]|jgi:SAM-dependent methyltransferase|nr:hypothetical protein [Rickettsiales bacterium]
MKSFEEIKLIYDEIFKDLNGYGVSLLEKQQKIGDKYIRDLIYGETPLELLYALFHLDFIKDYMNKGKVFYDLGSGIGNTVIGSYLIGNFNKCVGVELLDSLYNIAEIARNRLLLIDNNAKNSVHFIHKNILDINIGDGDVILFCCPNKDDKIRSAMEQKFQTLRPGALVLSLLHVFEDKKHFKLLTSRMVRSAWGETPMMFYVKISNSPERDSQNNR